MGGGRVIPIPKILTVLPILPLAPSLCHFLPLSPTQQAHSVSAHQCPPHQTTKLKGAMALVLGCFASLISLFVFT